MRWRAGENGLIILGYGSVVLAAGVFGGGLVL